MTNRGQAGSMARGRIAKWFLLTLLAPLVSLQAPAMSAATPLLSPKAVSAQPGPGGSRLVPLAFSALEGWARDDHDAAFQTFAISCRAVVEGTEAVRSAQAPSPALVEICRQALAENPAGRGDARRFFEAHFQPFLVESPEAGSFRQTGFLTGYYEPEVEGSRTRTEKFTAPLYARPPDLVTLKPGESIPGLDPTLVAARWTDKGLEPYPDRAAIEAGALQGQGLEQVYVRDEVEAFLIHVQGSVRVRLPDGSALRMAYAGRNGQPYSSIGRIIVEEGHVPKDALSLERMKAFLREEPDRGRAIMRRNRSFIFFRIAGELDPKGGPLGGAGVQLVPGRSLAVDRNLWSYGLPFFLSGTYPDRKGTEQKLARLMIAQDTGSAILGPARGDFFFGSGAAAGRQAGYTRHRPRFVVLLPKNDPAKNDPVKHGPAATAGPEKTSGDKP